MDTALLKDSLALIKRVLATFDASEPDPHHRDARNRPVTARDTEEAVRNLNGNGHVELSWPPPAQSVYESQDEVLSAIQRLHCPSGFDLDATYGDGYFWQTLPRPKLCYDLNPRHRFVRQGDFRGLPLKAGSIGSMVLDPPFLTYIRPENGGIMNGKFSGYWSYDDMMADYAAGIVEAHRVLKSKGVLVFKCQDTVHNHRLQLTHARVWSLAEEQGFRLQDLFILITTNRLPVRAAPHGRQVQRHARVHHSYFLVFRKR